MRRYLALFAALSLMATGTAAAGLRGVPPQFPKFAAGAGCWAHAEINMKVKRRWHTVIIDLGQITQASPTQVTLRECDGSVQQVPLDAKTIVSGAGKAKVRRGLYAETMRIDGGPAVRIRVTLRP
ncbi:MAG TPA: hypothetical protein VHC01_09930 [Gaiellaceae bacterium]|jgi:hypothetical protein|nr:hypothetical protein [Gaiellaceae bacterium]